MSLPDLSGGVGDFLGTGEWKVEFGKMVVEEEDEDDEEGKDEL